MDRIMTIYMITAIFLVMIDFEYACKAFRETEELGRYLGFAAGLAGIVTLAYMLSLMTDRYLCTSISSSIYFIGIDWMLVALVHFVYCFTGTHNVKQASLVRRIIRGYAVFDTAVLAVNVFREIAVHYVREDAPYILYRYEMKPLYILHLVFTYLLVVITLVILTVKAVRTPRQYRNQYILIIAAICGVILVNGIFLFLNGNTLIMKIDHSVVGYSLSIFLIYWSAFDYRRNDMLKSLSMTVFQNINQGIVLFDYMDELIMYNKKAEKLLEDIPFAPKMSASEFRSSLSIAEEQPQGDMYSLQLERRSSNNLPLRCDFRRLKDHRDRTTGKLYVLTEAENTIDLLTGFQPWDQFRRFAAENPYTFDHPTAAVVFDIIGLSEINRTFGREVGDQRIRNLVKTMKKYMPAGTYYVRGYEAHLIAVCYHCRESDIRENVENVIRACDGTVIYGMCATADATMKKEYPAGSTLNEPENRNIIKAIEAASRALHVKKLLSVESVHSQTLTSLVRALQESDSDTEEHVQRTQKMGAALGRRIGLSDSQLADLSLLCLLHDIGKIGIPLEILNKPGKLTDREWEVLRSHAEKGYQIAMSSDELKSIAEMILCHHERWDGKGYPQKLSGTAIPVLSRVISIVDSYDAMVNDRAYRKGMSPEAAQNEVRRCAGTQFDPYLAEEFLRMLGENPDIARGESTGAAEVKVFRQSALTAPETGNTVAVAYSRYILDLEDNIVEVDGAFAELTGYTAAEAVGRMSQFDLIPAEDKAYYMVQVNNQFMRGSIAFLEHDIERKDGSRIRVNCIGKRYYDSAVKAYRSEIFVSRVA